MRGANDRNFNGKSVATLGNIPSALAIALESAKWLYNADGTTKVASELKRSELHAAYTGHGRKLFAQLHFIEENEAVEAAIQSVDTPYQDFVSTMLKKPDELGCFIKPMIFIEMIQNYSNIFAMNFTTSTEAKCDSPAYITIITGRLQP